MTQQRQPEPTATAHARILVIDDEDAICFAFTRYFESRGFSVRTAGTGEVGLRLFRTRKPDIVFLDVRLPDCDGLEILGQLREESPDVCVIVITAYGSLNAVARAIRGKAYDCLVKPIDLDRAADLATQFLAERTMQNEAGETALSESEDDAHALIGRSESMQAVFKSIGRAATTDSAVLVTGATGTGKELTARAIHRLSRRRGEPFVAVNCGGLPENLVESELFGHSRGAFTGAVSDKPGRFETANGGTLFLDEIGELPPAAQVKLLRFLDGHVVERVGDATPRQLDVRIVAATNRSLAAAMADGSFRPDLYYRIAVIEIGLPTLAERREDIPLLAEHFIRQCHNSDAPTLSPDVKTTLKKYAWPGNVRELRNVIEHAITMAVGGAILPSHLPLTLQELKLRAPAEAEAMPARFVDQYLDAVGTDGDNLISRIVEPVEEAIIQRILQETNGNQIEAAARLGIHRNTLRRRFRQLNV